MGLTITMIGLVGMIALPEFFGTQLNLLSAAVAIVGAVIMLFEQTKKEK